MHCPPAPQPPFSVEGAHVTASAPQFHEGTFVDASATQVPPDAFEPLIAPTALQIEPKVVRSVQEPCVSDIIPQLVPWQVFWALRDGSLHPTPVGEPHVQPHCALAIDAFAPPANDGTKPAPQDGALSAPSHRTRGPVQPPGTGGAHVVPMVHPESKPEPSDDSAASVALVSM
jgi:hypothetical protein